MRVLRRTLLLGGGALAAAATFPIVLGGMESFLRRVVAGHFGPEFLDDEGIGEFIAEYAAQAGRGSFVKRAGAEAYFAWRGDLVHMIGPAKELQSMFLNTLLTRSNIIALYNGAESGFSYSSVDPWEPTCGLYLSSLADQNISG